MNLKVYKRISYTILLVLILMLIFSTTALAISLSGHSIVLDSYIGKSSSESTTSAQVYYVYVQTQLWNDDNLRAWNDEGNYYSQWAGEVNAYWTGWGDKYARGYHSKQDTSSSSTTSFYSYDYN